MQAKIDSVGRVLIPKQLRDALGLSSGSTVDISFYGGGLQLTVGGRKARIVDENGEPVATSDTSFGDEEMFALIDTFRR